MFQLKVENQLRMPEKFNMPFMLHWVNANTFEALWSKDIDYLPPGTAYCFKASYFIYRNFEGRLLSQPVFNCGRHRSRWLLDLGLRDIPLGLSGETKFWANITSSIITLGTVILLPIKISNLISEQEMFNNIVKN